MSASGQSPIKGLPEGVELVQIGVAKADDFELINEVDPKTGVSVTRIYQGMRPGAASGVIVKAADGWSFRCDPKTMSFFPVKNFPALSITATASFSVTNSFDQDAVKSALEKLKQVPGFQDLKEE